MSSNRWMDKEDVVHIYNGILLSHQKGWIPTICINMDGTGGDYAKWNKSSRERQLSYGFTHMWNIRNSTEDHRGKEGKLGRNQRGKQTMKDSGLWETNWGLQKGGVWGDGVTGWWALRRTHVVMSTGCYTQLMNRWTLDKKWMIHPMLANWTN